METSAYGLGPSRKASSASNVYHAPGWLQEPRFADVMSGLFLLDDGFDKACEFVIGGTPSH